MRFEFLVSILTVLSLGACSPLSPSVPKFGDNSKGKAPSKAEVGFFDFTTTPEENETIVLSDYDFQREVVPYVAADTTQISNSTSLEEFKENGKLEVAAPHSTPIDLEQMRTTTYLIIDEKLANPSSLEKIKAKVSTYIPLSAYFTNAKSKKAKRPKLRVELEEATDDESKALHKELKASIKRIAVQFKPVESN